MVEAHHESSLTPDEAKTAEPATPRATIVVPCYNQAHFLEECLASVAAQSDPRWEAVVVDDASPDGEDIRAVVEGMGDDRIRLVRHEENKGLGAARNTGIRAARTEYVFPLDSDDRITPDCVERLAGILEDDDRLDCAYADVQLFGRLNDVLQFPGPRVGFRMLRAEDTIPGAGTMMRKRLWERLGGYDEADVLRRGREDFEFWIRAFDAGCRAHRELEPVYEYRHLHTSMNVTCRLQDHVIAEYIYGKHRRLFDEAGEGERFLCYWTEKAATASFEHGMHLRAFGLGLRAWSMAPSRRRLKRALRSLLPISANLAIDDGQLRRLTPFARYPLRGAARHRPFFVIGVGRSGNTLLRRILTSNSKLHVPPETFVLRRVIRLWEKHGSRLRWSELVAFVMAQFQFHPEFHTFELDLEPLFRRLIGARPDNRNLAFLLDSFYRYHAEVRGVTPLRWGDKTPMNSLDDATQRGDKPRRIGAGVPETLERLLEVFPDAQFIHLYRDGCDVVLSHLRGGFYGRVEDAANRWLHVERQTRRFARRHPEASLDVRYEDLVSEPEETVRSICEFLEIDFEEGMLSSESTASALGDVPAWSWHAQVAQPINPSNPGKARRAFTPAEKEELQRLIGDELAELGYPPATAGNDAG
jgi:glycosyltransferase involved in cell wall biosynthesis